MNDEESSITPLTERAMSPTNTTTTSMISYPNSNHCSYSFPMLKSMAVQTDETSFCKALIKEPWMKLYSPNEFDYDSGIHSIACSPKFSTTDSYMRSLSPGDSLNECIINRERIITPPPGFRNDRFKILPAQLPDVKQEKQQNIAPIPHDPVPCYSLFDGPTIGLGEEILRRIHNRTLVNYDLVEYNLNIKN
uniref:Uncharacterized protein n=1 Tax=Panagrolaimus davidi TaxID=227884 RepID=A0A914QJB0_9BILA